MVGSMTFPGVAILVDRACDQASWDGLRDRLTEKLKRS